MLIIRCKNVSASRVVMIWDLSKSSRLMSHHLVKKGCDHAVGDLYEIVDEEHF